MGPRRLAAASDRQLYSRLFPYGTQIGRMFTLRCRSLRDRDCFEIRSYPGYTIAGIRMVREGHQT